MLGLWKRLSLFFGAEYWDVKAAREMPASSLRTAKSGLVKLVGVVDGAALEAPLDGEPCVGFELMLEAIGHRHELWDVGSVREVPDFTLRGDDGVVRVRGDGVRIKLLTMVTREVTAEEVAHLFPRKRLPRLSRLRATQWAIRKGARVAVVGVVKQEPDPDPAAATSYRESGTRLVVESPEGERAYLVDDPRALT
jgi:hypothetical protein